MKSFIQRCVCSGRALLAASLLLLSVVVPVIKPALAHATPTFNFVSGTDVSGLVDTVIPITDLRIDSANNSTTDMHLFVPEGTLSMSVTNGLTFTGDTSGSSLYFSGTVTSINAALETLTYTSSIVGSFTLSASLVGPGQSYNPSNGHVYEIIKPGGGGLSWNQAKTAADARSYNGAQGYLATVTDQQENDFVVEQLHAGDGWIGSSDSTTEGTWKWVDGPETGTTFYTGGVPVEGKYNNWNNNEPNGGEEESCGQYTINSNGRWNDLPCDTFPLDGYVVEYGSEEELTAVPSKELTITTSFPAGDSIAINDCAALQAIDDDIDTQFNQYVLSHDIDCSAVENFEPIGLDSEGWDGEPFRGEFDGNGHTISGLNINNDGPNVGLFSYSRNASIHDLHLTDGNIVDESGFWTGMVGSVVGNAEATAVSNVSSDLTVNAQTAWAVGGIVGYIDDYLQDNAVNSTVSDTSYTGTIVGQLSTGGIVGAVEAYDGMNTTISRSYSEAQVWSQSGAGGIVGSVYVDAEDHDNEPDTEIDIVDSYSRSEVTADDQNAGGIVGTASMYNDGYDNLVTSNVVNSYSSGTVTANNGSAGGIIGHVESSDNDYSVLSIQGTFVAGLVQTNTEEMGYAIVGGEEWSDGLGYTIENNYYDATRTQVSYDTYLQGSDTGVVNVDPEDNEADYFFNNSIKHPLDTWDFENIWVTNAIDFPTFIPSNNTEPTEVASAEDSTIVAIEQSGCDAVDNLTANKESSLSVQDAAYSYPVGFVGFHLTGCTQGGEATVTVTFTSKLNVNDIIARKINTTTNAYSTITSATKTATTLHGQPAIQLSYTVTDGGPLDQDGQTNGTIIDPVGLATLAVGSPNTGIKGVH